MKGTDPLENKDSLDQLVHELNNPLASIIGFSELLLGSELENAVRKDVEKIHREAIRMKEILHLYILSERENEPQ